MGNHRSVLEKGGNYTGKDDQFHPIRDKTAIHQTIMQACDNEASVVLWTRNQEHVIRTQLSSGLMPKKWFFAKIQDGNSLQAMTTHLVKNNTSECQILIYQPQKAVIGFRCTLLGIEGSLLKIHYPELIYRVQRRQYQRYSIRKGYQIELEYKERGDEEETLRRPILDMSVGGLAFLISNEEAINYSVGMDIKEAEIDLRSRRLSVDLKIQNTNALAGNSANNGIQVGAAFTRISVDDIEFLSFYIGENTALV